MSRYYTLSAKAQRDIHSIAKQSMANFGEMQTREYVTGLKEVLGGLAINPDKGKSFTNKSDQREYCYLRYMSHVVYYRQRERDIFIIRILHRRMLPERHL